MLLSDVFQFQIRYKISPKVSPLLGVPRKPPSGPGGFLRSKPPCGSTPRSLCMSGHILSLNSNEREWPAVMCKNFCHVHSYIKMEKGMRVEFITNTKDYDVTILYESSLKAHVWLSKDPNFWYQKCPGSFFALLLQLTNEKESSDWRKMVYMECKKGSTFDKMIL